MINLTTEPAELRFTLKVTRKETGRVESFEMIGHTNPDAIKKLIEENNHGSDPQHSGA